MNASIQTLKGHIPPESAGRRFDQALAELFPDYSRSRLTQWIKSGDALLDGVAAVPRQIVRGGEAVTLSAESTQEVPMAPEAIALDIRYEDADVLVNALKHRGYNVAIRHEPQDKLLHVQIGPFPTKKDADAMKQRLQTDGYNAIVK